MEIQDTKYMTVCPISQKSANQINAERKVRNAIESYVATENEIRALVDTYTAPEIESAVELKEAALNHALNNIKQFAGVDTGEAVQMIDDYCERINKKKA